MVGCFRNKATVLPLSGNHVPSKSVACQAPEIPSSEPAPEALPQASLRQQIIKQVESGRRKRDESNLRRIFDEYKDPGSNRLRSESLVKACNAADMVVENQSTIFEESRIDMERGMEFDDFKNMANTPSELEILMKSIPFHQIWTDAVPLKPGCDPLECFGNLTSHEIDVMVEASVEYLKQILKEQSSLSRAVKSELRKTSADLRAGISKFTCMKMKAGTISDFHEGLGRRVGALAVAMH